jgi:hypothetical protein
LATDYRRMTKGRTLVVAHVYEGSIIARLREALDAIAPYTKEALEFSKAAKNLTEFASRMYHLIVRAKEDPVGSDLFRNKRRPGVKSSEKLLEIAMSVGGEVEVQRKLPSGEEINFRVTSLEAVRIREEGRTAIEDRSHYYLPLSESKRRLPGNSGTPALFDASSIADRLAQTGGPEAEAVISAIAATLREIGMGHIMAAVASKLEERGLHLLAARVRATVASDAAQRSDNQPGSQPPHPRLPPR